METAVEQEKGERRQRGRYKEEEKEAMRRQHIEGGVGGWGGGMGYLSAFDVKSLRQKHSGAECCPTCTGSTQHQRQHGDGEDEGREIKTSVEEIK